MNDPVSNTGNNISKRTFSRTSRHAELHIFLREGLDKCDEICYKDPVLKDRPWSAYIDSSPGSACYLEFDIPSRGSRSSSFKETSKASDLREAGSSCCRLHATIPIQSNF
ncbi:unnamed protein product [Fraxinus pennsylvanica]|uniref:Uncharacterized protein n=1 Tax=Fraxinus pennsylvanica TaxID=56036 RepID=A0AAD2AGS5_9LAMI|nr:unnamed protein product [Fraxinus pennsylvanica]